MHPLLAKQLSLDYCCSVADVEDYCNHFTVYTPLEGRRRFDGETTAFLKVAALNGKILVTGQPDAVNAVREHFGDYNGAWFMEARPMAELNEVLREFGYRIRKIHPFFISDRPVPVDIGDYEIRWYRGEEIQRFAGDKRFDAAFSFCDAAPDVIGVAALQEGKILGMAGVSADSPDLWQIGINTEPEARGRGIAPMLVGLLRNAVLEEGKLPYYGTAFSHINSQKVAIRSGFAPAWSELITDKIPK